jgi:hypothetical protein
MTDITGIKERLKSNPIYALSLGSRELFHSNFLGWMCDNYPSMIAVFFDVAMPEKVKVEREKNNLDLKITFDEHAERRIIVIEIKVKDSPKPPQLSGYSDGLKNEDIKVDLVLLSLVDAPESVKKEDKWFYLSFDDLGNKIKKRLLYEEDIPSDHASIIKLYAELCCDLDAMMTLAIETDQEGWKDYFKITGKVESALEEIRFADTLRKHRASVLCEEFKKRQEEIDFKVGKTDFDFGFNQKMSHAGGVLALELQDARKSKIHLGIHIQEMQYRRVLFFDGYQVLRRKEKDPESLRAFIDETDGWRWMFGIEHYDGIFHKPNEQGGFFEKKTKIPTSQQKNKLLCSYAPVHIYQYTNIGVEAGVPISEVVDAVIADLQYAAQLLTDPSYLARFEKWLQKS